MTSRHRVLECLKGRKVDRPPLMPITMMFAADQIGRPYGQYATDFHVLAEAQIRTAERFGFDHVSGISDPAREAADCGAQVRYFPDQPPAIDEDHALLTDKAVLRNLKPPDPLGGGRMNDRVNAVDLMRRRVGQELLVEGWVEGPCAQAADLRGINALMLDFFDDPGFVRDVFAFVVELEVAFARAQVQAGAELIGMGDAAASLVGPELYEQFVWPFEKQQIDAIHALGVPVRLHICGNTRPLLPLMGKLGADLIDLDYFAPPDEARAAMGPSQALLGNIDPVRVLRHGTPTGIAAAIAQCHRAAGDPYVVGAGCEVPRDTPAQNVLALRDYALSAR